MLLLHANKVNLFSRVCLSVIRSVCLQGLPMETTTWTYSNKFTQTSLLYFYLTIQTPLPQAPVGTRETFFVDLVLIKTNEYLVVLTSKLRKWQS